MCSIRSLASVLVILAVSTSTTSGGGVCITKIKDGKMVSEGDCENSRGNSVLMDLDRKLKARVPCTNGMMYENKCFIPVVDRNVNYDDGVAICEGLGGQLANIYSQTHMDDVMKYNRDNRLGGSSWRYFRLGMKYDPKADKLTLRDGTDAPVGLKWYPGSPLTVEVTGEGVADYTNVILAVHSDQSSTMQYLFNRTPWHTTSYVLCETE